MKDIIRFIFYIILCGVILGIVVIGLATYLKGEEENDWNNDYCKCGGHWVYEQAIGHAYSTSYLYRCDECGKTIEFSEYQVTEVQNE